MTETCFSATITTSWTWTFTFRNHTTLRNGFLFWLTLLQRKRKIYVRMLKDFRGLLQKSPHFKWPRANDLLYFPSVSPSVKPGGKLLSGKWRINRKMDWEGLAWPQHWLLRGPLPLHNKGMFLSVYLSFFCFLHRPWKLSFEVHFIIAFYKNTHTSQITSS